MTLTIMSAAKEVSAMERPDMESLAKSDFLPVRLSRMPEETRE